MQNRCCPLECLHVCAACDIALAATQAQESFCRACLCCEFALCSEEPTGSRRLLQAKAFFINSDSNQQAKIVDGNIQGGKSMIHIIDAVLVPESLIKNYNLSTEGLPGVVPGKALSATPATESKSVEAPAAAPAAKSSAVKAVAALLAVPALLAALMF